MLYQSLNRGILQIKIVVCFFSYKSFNRYILLDKMFQVNIITNLKVKGEVMTNCKKILDFSDFILHASYKGYELLALHSKIYPGSKIPKSILSYLNPFTQRTLEASEWLYNISSYLILKDIELIEQEDINCAEDFFRLADTLSSDTQMYIFDELLPSVEFYEHDPEEFENISDLPYEILDDFLYENPFRLTTLSSKLFDLNSDILVALEDYIPEIVCHEANLTNDHYLLSFINSSSETAFHSSKKYSVSFSILSLRSTSYSWYSFSDTFNGRISHDFPAKVLKKVYMDLL